MLVALGVIGALTQHKSTPYSKREAKPTSSPAPGAPAGYVTYSSSKDNFTIALPSSWKEVDPTSPGAAAAFNRIQQANPNLYTASMRNAMQQAANGMVLFAIDPAGDGTGFNDTVNVAAEPDFSISSGDLSSLGPTLKSQFEAAGATKFSSSTVTFDSRQALEVSLQLPLNSPNGNQLEVHETQFYVDDPGNSLIYVVTLAGGGRQLQTIADTFSISG